MIENDEKPVPYHKIPRINAVLSGDLTDCIGDLSRRHLPTFVGGSHVEAFSKGTRSAEIYIFHGSLGELREAYNRLQARFHSFLFMLDPLRIDRQVAALGNYSCLGALGFGFCETAESTDRVLTHLAARCSARLPLVANCHGMQLLYSANTPVYVFTTAPLRPLKKACKAFVCGVWLSGKRVKLGKL